MAKPPSSPDLAEWIDLEFALDDLEEHRAAARAAGDQVCAANELEPQAARRRAETDATFRQQLALAWLARLHQGGAALPGSLLTRSLRAAGKLLLLLAALGGMLTASSTLRYDGSSPVNLWSFLGIFVLLQLLLLLGTLLLALRSRNTRSLGAGPIGNWVERLASHPWLQRVLAMPEQETRQAWSQLRERRRQLARTQAQFARAERWLLVRFSQAAGVLFHLAAAFTFVAIALFSDLSFAWSTTPAGIDAHWLHGLVTALAAPWSWLLPEFAPSLEQVSMTQWSRLDGAFVAADQAVASTAAAAWWSFLLAAQLCWGLLPRAATWGLAGWQSRRCMRSMNFDHAGFHALFDAMLLDGRRSKTRNWSGPQPAQIQGERVDVQAGQRIPTLAVEETVRPAHALAWGAFPGPYDGVADLLEQNFGWQIQQPQRPAMVGGSDAAASAAELKRLIAAAAKDRAPTVALYAEAAEAPNKALLRTLAQLRQQLPENATLAVILLGEADEETVALWRGYLARADDPQLRVEVLR